MPDSTLSQALREAYASADVNSVVYGTLEIWHPSFDAPIRVVQDYVDLEATLEPTAPRNPGETVTFVRFSFKFKKPELLSTGLPEIQITLDNVDRVIVANIEAALQTSDIITVTYREYLSTDLSIPQNDPPLELSISNIVADPFKVVATAGYPNLLNKRFPTNDYDPDVFVGLTT